ncbi:MAG: nicotinate-nucleotide--dimethylbenzimidazole phosphoribosyltransferase [Algicola sp.]|nr:nicotinate-nucleotide--dimethylbenzimidazole phosphoribosyltransferase [Algicola sp.]
MSSLDIQQQINNKTKPPGALGQLESLALQLAMTQGLGLDSKSAQNRIEINKPTVLVFAADHGVSEEGISIAPSEVTAQMVSNFLAGGAAINCFCRTNDVALEVIDAGIKHTLTPHPDRLTCQAVAKGTKNLSTGPSMTLEQAHSCLEFGAAIANKHINNGCNVLALGEMGIGNTTSAAAILAALSDAPVQRCVGRGTGITDEQLTRKTQLIEQALARFDQRDALSVLSEVGGFEIGQICGAILAAAERKITILIDGFIVSTGALLASKIKPEVLEYMVFAHCSDESGHRLMLDEMRAKPLLNLGLRLGEGTGAVLAIPLLRCAASFYNDMATFDSAGVTV